MCPYATIFVLSSVCRASFNISTHFISKIPLRNGRFIGVTGAVPVGLGRSGFEAVDFVLDRSFWLLPEMCSQSSNSFSINTLFFPKIPLQTDRAIGVIGVVPVGPIPFGFGAYLFRNHILHLLSPAPKDTVLCVELLK